MPLLSLPTDVLPQIFTHCSPLGSITETCREFADVVYSTPSLWRKVYIGQRQFVSNGPRILRSRLGRAGILPLMISIDFAGSELSNMVIVDSMCVVLSEHNARIDRVEVGAQTAMVAGRILSTIFPSSQLAIFPALSSLSIKVEQDPGHYSFKWPQLDAFLQHFLPSSFPNLHTIALPTHFPCIPVFETVGTPFNHNQLRTLIFDGSVEEEEPSMALIVGLLHYTPQLETLWLKTVTTGTCVSLTPPAIPRCLKNTQDIPIPVALHHLVHLSITAPGAGSDLLLCIDAPALQYLHLDGSRGPLYQELTGTAEKNHVWSQFDITTVQSAMELLAQRSPHLRQLSLTATCLTEEGWHWLLLGHELEGPPFPLLKSLALRQLDLKMFSDAQITCGFHDSLLLNYSAHSSRLLQKLSLRQFSLPLDGSTLLRVFSKSIERCPGVSYMLEINLDSSSTWLAEDHLRGLSEAGVTVNIDCEEEECGWWAQGHQIDGPGSHAY